MNGTRFEVFPVLGRDLGGLRFISWIGLVYFQPIEFPTSPSGDYDVEMRFGQKGQ
jgi:hypothetical protein